MPLSVVLLLVSQIKVNHKGDILKFRIDVSNYNLLRGAEDPAQAPNPNYDEELYINALAPLLTQNNFPAHFIVDRM